MRYQLRAHADSHPRAVRTIDVEVVRTGNALHLRYEVHGDLADIVWPTPARSARADELWKSTCFEAFVRPEGGAAYYELNFAPSTQWAAYRFDAYRAGMAPALDAPTHIAVRPGAEEFVLDATVTLPSALETWRLALTAVIEEKGGAKSYWALAHPPEKPDFHHADGFALTLPAETR